MRVLLLDPGAPGPRFLVAQEDFIRIDILAPAGEDTTVSIHRQPLPELGPLVGRSHRLQMTLPAPVGHDRNDGGRAIVQPSSGHRDRPAVAHAEQGKPLGIQLRALSCECDRRPDVIDVL